MGAKERALSGAFSGIGATLVLSGLREAWARVGLVFETAPMQVVHRMEEVGLVGDLSPWGRRLLTVVAQAPWTQKTPRVLLPVIDHAAFGAAWGLINLVLSRRRA